MTPARRVRRAASSLTLVAGLLACGPAGNAPASPALTSPATAPSTRETTGPSASTTAPTAPTDPSPIVSGGPNAVVVDAELLVHLPVAVAGAALMADATSAARVAADPSLGASASAIAIALVVVASGEDEDLAISSVVRLRPGVYSDAFFADWRASYDRAACAPAGGATGEVARTIAGSKAFVGACVGGVITYHVHLPDGGLLVSITSVGARDLGALVVAGLR